MRLEYGKTPWDNLGREQLLLEVWRMWAALVSARSILSIHKAGSHPSPYWSDAGSGGQALAMADAIVEPTEAKCGGEGGDSIYRAFFRYAADLLFPDKTRWAWTACDGCAALMAVAPEAETLLGKPCQECARMTGEVHLRRLLEWRDILGKDHPMLPLLTGGEV